MAVHHSRRMQARVLLIHGMGQMHTDGTAQFWSAYVTLGVNVLIAGGSGSSAPAPDSASAVASGPTADLVDNLGTDTTVTPQGQSAAGLAANLVLPLGSAAVAALLLLAAAP